MGKHTPGPWQIRFARNGYPYQIDAPNGSEGAGGIRTVTRWGAISFPSSTEGLANARLIAAAPDLLEAAKTLVESHKEADPMAAGMMLACALHMAEAAIARATGEQP